MNQIIISDRYQNLKEEVKKLQTVIAALTSERDDLIYNICPELEARYAREIGNYVNRLNYQRILILETKRRIEIVQAALNREKTVSAEHVDEQVREEYQDFHEKVREEYQKAERAQRKQREKQEKRKRYEERWREQYGDRDSESSEHQEDNAEEKRDAEGEHEADSEKSGQRDGEYDDAEWSQTGEHRKQTEKSAPNAKELYRKIIKKLHPDANPNVTEHEKELFNRAVRAYQDGDIVTLQKIYDEVFRNESLHQTEKELSFEELAALERKLKTQIAALQKEIDTIRQSYPYQIKEFLDDTETVAKKRKELEREIARNEETLKRLTKIYERICLEMEQLQKIRNEV